MNVIEIFRELFTRDLAENRNKKTNTTWEYEQFREYLLSLSLDPQHLISINDYPQTIRLSSNWHEILDKMRRESQDGLERLSFIGGRGNRLIVQKDFIIGEPHQISSKLVSKSIRQGINKTGTVFIGTIHSHPRKKLELNIFWGLIKERVPHVARFSADDLYFLIDPYRTPYYDKFLLTAIVEGNSVAFTFRSQETEGTEINSLLISQKSFASYWEQKEKDDIRLQSDLEIIKRHNLVFYRGNVGEDLRKH